MIMIKRIVFAVALLLSFQWVAAQSVSDEQVVKILMAEKDKGTDENTIAQKLLSQGVTPAQLRRIKAKYEQEQKGLGVVGRTEKDKNAAVNRNNSGLMLGDGFVKADRGEKVDLLQNEMSFLDIDSVAYFSNLLKKDEVYGRDIFNNKLLTFEPAGNIPAPADYVLGAGDQVLIDVWGASQVMIDSQITPDGSIVVEGVGPLHLAGKSVKEANEYIKDILGDVYAESNMNLSVGAVRSIQVQVVGEVTTPGSYTVSALSTVFNVLYAAGGISEHGTLRSINVFRNNKKISTVDVYDFIFNGNLEGNVRLQDNDVVSVGVYDAIVNVQGKVKRPMLYEMKGNETLANLVKYSGGFKGDAYDGKMRVVRKNGREYSLFTVDKENFGTFKMCDKDSVYVDSIISRFSNMVEIKGAVFFPGQYQYGEDIRTVFDLIEAAGGLREDAFLNRAVLHHRNADNTIEALSVDVDGIMDGRVPDIALRNNDVLFIPSESEMKGEQVVKIDGEVNFPGTYKFAKNTTIEDLILQAGGLTRAASTSKIDVYRQLYNPAALKGTKTITESFTFTLKDGFIVEGGASFVLEPFDEVFVRRSPINKTIQNVTINGAVNFEGKYAMLSKNYRISDLLKAAGGVSENAFVKGAYMYRKMTDEEKLQRKIQQKKQHIDLYEEMLRSDNMDNQAVLDSIASLKAKFEEHFSLAIDLEKAIANPGSIHDVILREGDVITVPEQVSTVKISGEVMQPTSVSFQKNKKLSYYIDHAGGYTNSAKKKGVYVIYMNGSIEKISRSSKKAIQPGCEIVVPRKQERKKMSTAEIMTIGTSTVSLATMIVSLINILK